MKQKDNVIFLDFDGVLNKKLDDFSESAANPEAVFYVNKLCLENDFKIVVCSSWRHRDNYEQILHDIGIDEKIGVLGKTKNNPNGREAEIKDFLEDHDIAKYLIIDDAYLSDDIEDHHVQPASRLGFTKNKYEEALKKISKL